MPLGSGRSRPDTKTTMRLDERFLDELKSRLRPSEVIGRTIKLKRQGREWVGLSPFTKEKSPSFFVNDDKGFFHDFSSGKHGDIISFLQETQRLSFMEAVERLAAEAGMALPEPDPQAARREEARKGLEHWLEEAAHWFEAQLRRPPGQNARDYLVRRALPEDQWARFRLGYAPASRTALRDALIQKGAKPQELVDAGLLIRPEDGGQPYDRFRDRVIFPITDARGRLISFGGRALNPDDRAKYLNGPETSVFHKGSNLYGLAEARRLLAQGEKDARLVVVEGYMDVIACQRAGVAAVAPMGTALTEEQMGVLWRHAPTPVLCFDGDNAGRRAAMRAIERALPLLKPDRTFDFCLLAGGLDPDDILRELGAPGLRQALAQTTPFSALLFEREREEVGSLDTPEKEANLVARLRKAAATIADPDLARTYKDYLVNAFYAHVRPSEAERKQANRVQYRDRRARAAADLTRVTPEARTAAASLSQAPRPLVAAVVEGLIAHPEVVREKSELLGVQGVGDDGLDRLINDLIPLVEDLGDAAESLVRARLSAMGHNDTLRRIERTAPLAHASFLDRTLPEREAGRDLIRALELVQQAVSLSRALQELKGDLSAEASLDSEAFIQLKAERDAASRALIAGQLWPEDTVH